MDPQDAIDFSREAIRTCLFVGGPILIACLVIGLLVSVFQAMTQLHDQTISFVPKILLLLTMIALSLPWLSDQMLDFARVSFEKPMMPLNYVPPETEPARPTSPLPTVLESAERSHEHVAGLPTWEESVSAITVKANLSDRSADRSTSSVAAVPGSAPRQDGPAATPSPRTASPFLLPQYRFEQNSRADPAAQPDDSTNIEG